jgi:microsomal dipeptidase-like Zn-dependent dipeptidase
MEEVNLFPSAKRSGSGSLAAVSNTPSDQKLREEKTVPYQDSRYKTLLKTKGSFMRNYVGTIEEGIKEDSKRLWQTLLGTEQFIQDISWLLVPPA